MRIVKRWAMRFACGTHRFRNALTMPFTPSPSRIRERVSNADAVAGADLAESANARAELAAGVDLCVVVVSLEEVEDWYPICGEPVVGERGGWPMCRKHLDLFAPEPVDA